MSNNDICKKLVFFPQFGATCWFNALLMATLYSQQSRELLLSASKSWDTRIKIYKIFKHLLHHKYMRSKNPQKDFKFFVDIKPENILRMLYRYDKNSFMLNKFDRGFNAGIYIGKFYKMLNVNCIMLTRFNDHILYDTLNHIKSVNFKKNGIVRTITESKTSQYIATKLKEVPDVLVVRCIENDVGSRLPDNRLMNTDNIRNVMSMDNVIVYNNCTYELDSIILNNWNYESKSSHAISGVTCNGNRYVYNGWTVNTVDPAMKNVSTNLNSLPCELMKFDWNVKQDVQFCLNQKQCKLDLIYKTIPKDMCFSFNKGDRLLIYIKKDPLTTKLHIPSKTPDYRSLNEKDCPNGKIRDPVTKRCINIINRKKKISVPVSTRQECKDGQVRDPVTKRCVSFKTAMKRNLINQQPKLISPKKKIPVPGLPDCKDGKVRDPVTKRCVSLKTAKLRKLV